MRRVFPQVFSTLRPSSYTCGLPGNGKTRAHAGKPSSRQQSHQKLATLDPVVAHKELLSAHPAPKAQALAAQLNRAEATAPPAPRHPITRLAKALARGVGKVTGFHPGKPQSQEQLLRYAGTAPPAVPEAAQDPAQALVQALGHEQAHLLAQIDVNEANGVDALVTQHLEQVEKNRALANRRAANLSARAHFLIQPPRTLCETLRGARAFSAVIVVSAVSVYSADSDPDAISAATRSSTACRSGASSSTGATGSCPMRSIRSIAFLIV